MRTSAGVGLREQQEKPGRSRRTLFLILIATVDGAARLPGWKQLSIGCRHGASLSRKLGRRGPAMDRATARLIAAEQAQSATARMISPPRAVTTLRQ